MSTVLIVEDEPGVAAALEALLAREGYTVLLASSLAAARRTFAAQGPSLGAVLLDWRLPDGEGVDWLREIRATSEVPVLLVTARVEVIDRVLGLELGADDYVTKPFEPRELLARLRARLRGRRKSPEAGTRVVDHAGVHVDLASREVTFEGRAVPMTRMEFGLLALLLEHPGRVFSREELLNRVWGYERTPTTRTVDTHVVQLRAKLRPELIESVRGVGYRVPRGGAN